MSYLSLTQLQDKIGMLQSQLDMPGLSKEIKKDLKEELEALEDEYESRECELSGY